MLRVSLKTNPSAFKGAFALRSLSVLNSGKQFKPSKLFKQKIPEKKQNSMVKHQLRPLTRHMSEYGRDTEYVGYNNSKNKDLTENEFISKIHTKVGHGMVTTLGIGSGIALLAGSTLASSSLGLGLILGGTVGSFGALYGFIKAIERDDRPASKKWYYGFCAVNGVMVAPITSLAFATSPYTLPLATALTACTIGGTSMYAKYNTNKDIGVWGAPLFGALAGMVGMSIVSIGAHLIFPASGILGMWFGIEPYLGIGLFSMLNVYDTHVAITKYKENPNVNPYEVVFGIYQNALNLFIRFLQILIKAQSKKN